MFHEQLGLPFQLGIMITLFLCFIVIMKGLNGILAINSYTVPVMIIFIVFLAIAVFTQYPDGLAKQMTLQQGEGDISWIISPFTYSAFNIITAQVVLVPLGNEVRNEHMLKWAGFWGGVVLFTLLLINHLLLSAFPETFTQEIPMAEIVQNFGGFIHLLFLFVIYAEIFNSVIGNVFGVTRQLKAAFGIRYRHGLFLILIVIFLASQAGYGQLVNMVYPFLDYIGLVALVVLLLKKYP